MMEPRPRIISLIASSTEIVCALGLQPCLVGRSHECDYPLSVKTLPQCTSPKFPTDGTSYDIDQKIKAIVSEGLSVYRVDSEMLRRLRPDIIITQDQCEVCAVSLADVVKATCDWLHSGAKVVSLKTDSLSDFYRDIGKVADAVSAYLPKVQADCDALIARLQKRTQDVGAHAAEKLQKNLRPRVATIEWIKPLMTAGNWMPELIELAGGTSLFGVTGKHSPWITWDEIKHADPDILFISPCGFNLDQTEKEMPELTHLSGFSQLKAVREGRVFLADGNQYFHRPGPRLVESLEIFAEMFWAGKPVNTRGWKAWRS